MYLDAKNLYGWAMSPTLLTFKFLMAHDEEMKELDVKIIPDDSLRGYISECDLGDYYFYYLYIHAFFIKCNVSFLHISENPRDFIKCNVSFLCISEYPHELHDLHKDYPLPPEYLQIEENISEKKSEDLANLHPNSSRTYATKRTTSSTAAI